ncbi:ribonuclease-3 [Butyrivibrio sp. INlla18]|uniref:ribonuclease III family protein n=1 Tax=Butyrivibrio sp. INlla18 TaxID=1520806 RepID=UPI000890B1C7|nr:ribonuclease III domain-containing protein [Butyrivibrio sp. INlla18]SDA62577.1 ribonuclease-3 [Butyrivibrio sp. INlla18]
MEKREGLFERMVPHQIGGYKFKNPKLLRQAFVRRSYTQENGGENNEVLEFIGDKALDIAMVRYLSEKYGTDLHIQDKIPEAFRVPQEPQEFSCSLSEGELTKLKQKLVEKKTLAARIDELDLAQFLIVGKGDEQKNIAEVDSVKEDLFEAILGAVALDSNWDFDKIQNVAEVMLRPDSILDNGEEADYVGLIYEWEAKKNGCLPYFMYFDGTPSRAWYKLEEHVIYDMNQSTYAHNNYNHVCRVKLLNDKDAFESYGASRNQARRAACKLAYKYLEKEGMLFSIRDEIDDPNIEDGINQLEILARRGYFAIPEFKYEETYDSDGNPIWNVECHIEEKEKFFAATASSKKAAKKQAAYKMLEYVLGEDEEV